MIIIEGPDAAGKSTLVEYIKKNSKLELIKPFYPKQDQLKYYLLSPSNYSSCWLERYYISELVYPQFKPNRAKMQPWHQYIIEAGLMPFAPTIIYVRPSKDTIKENILSRGDDYIYPDDVDKMVECYDRTIDNSYLPVFNYDYKTEDPSKFINYIVSHYIWRLEKAKKLQKFLSSGNYYEEGSVMFIGDMPSNQSIGNGFIRAFISNTGSSEFLHKCLFDAGVYPSEQMPYFTNWNKWEDNNKLNLQSIQEEIDIIKPKKIVCFGKEIKNMLGTGEVIEHPAYIKRFKSKDYSLYTDKIKNLFK
jgi:hypothetical protein